MDNNHYKIVHGPAPYNGNIKYIISKNDEEHPVIMCNTTYKLFKDSPDAILNYGKTYIESLERKAAADGLVSLSRPRSRSRSRSKSRGGKKMSRMIRRKSRKSRK